MSVTNLPHKHILLVAPLTTRDEARYRSRVAILPTQPAFDALVTRSSLEYRHKVWYGKTRMVWLPDGEKKIEDTFIRFDSIHEREQHKSSFSHQTLWKYSDGDL